MIKFLLFLTFITVESVTYKCYQCDSRIAGQDGCKDPYTGPKTNVCNSTIGCFKQKYENGGNYNL